MGSEESISNWIHRTYQESLWRNRSSLKTIGRNDQKKTDSREYQPGDKVWLEGTNITTNRPIKKLNDKRHGPFIIDKKIGESSYRLKLPATWKKVHATFNEKYLSPFIPAKYPSQKLPLPPPPIIVRNNHLKPAYSREESRRLGDPQWRGPWEPHCLATPMLKYPAK